MSFSPARTARRIIRSIEAEGVSTAVAVSLAEDGLSADDCPYDLTRKQRQDVRLALRVWRHPAARSSPGDRP